MLVSVVRKLLPHLPEAPAFWLTRQVASLVRSPPLRAADFDLVREMEPRWYGPRRNRWALLHGHGPLVLLVHGWAGRGTQMLPIARRLVCQGFRVLIPDITAHGQSAGLQVGFRDFVNDIADCCDALGQQPFAMVGHSAGALAMAAARRLRKVQAQRYVLLCAPRGPYIPVEEIRRRLDPKEEVLARCRNHFAAQLQGDWDGLDAGGAYRTDDGTPALLIYDRDDPRLHPQDPVRVERQWAGARLVMTSGLGHSKPLRDPEVIQRIVDFLQAMDLASPVQRTGPHVA
jgi:pimeloyl-ACP methyl ester carboxylesterase